MVIEELKALAYTIAPELGAAKMQLLRHQQGWPCTPDSGAYCLQPAPHRGIKAAMQQRGEWRGMFPTTIVFVQKPTLPILLHEMAHALPAARPVESVGVEDLPQWPAIEMGYANESCVDNSRPMERHGLEFTRAVLHLASRAQQLGEPVDLNDVGVAGLNYGLSRVEDYVSVLGDEPARMAGATFTEILESPAPAEFVRLFDDDVEAFAAGGWMKVFLRHSRSKVTT